MIVCARNRDLAIYSDSLLADKFDRGDRPVVPLDRMNAPSLGGARGEVLGELAAGTLFPPQRGLGHQFRQRQEIPRALVDLLSRHCGKLLDCASQIIGAADESYLAPHDLLYAIFDPWV